MAWEMYTFERDCESNSSLFSVFFFSGFEVVNFVPHILPALPSNKPMRNTLQAQSIIDWNL